jgi:hypothetical protein
MALYEHDSIATILDLHGVTEAPMVRLVRHSTTKPGDGVSVYLCNLLDDHGVKPVKILKQAGLRTATLFFVSCGERTGIVFMFFSLFAFSSGFTRGGLVTHNFSPLPGRSFVCILFIADI